jgi:hypothetical protein
MIRIKPLLMVRGWQSAPVVFAALVDFSSEHWEGYEEVDEGVSAILRRSLATVKLGMATWDRG